MKELWTSYERLYEFFAPKELLEKAQKEVLKINFYKNEHNQISFDMLKENAPSSEKNLIKNPKFKELHEWFQTCIQKVAKECLYNCEFKIIHSWANKTEKGQEHHEHNHPMALIGGVFYLTSGGGETYYQYEGTAWNKCFLRYVHKQYYYVKPEAGKLILFPSCVNHGVLAHKDEAPRYTISFDSFPDGVLGEMGKIGIDLKIKVQD